MSEGPSRVPTEVVRLVAEALGVQECALLMVDLDIAHLHTIDAEQTLGGFAGKEDTVEGVPFRSADGQTLTAVVLGGEISTLPRSDWAGHTPLRAEYLMAAPVRAGNEVTGVLVVGRDEPFGEAREEQPGAEASALRLLGYEAGAALYQAERYSDVLAHVQRVKRPSVAAEMQQDLLPPRELYAHGVSLAGGIEPAYDIGGDWFDYALRNGKLYATVGDPSGKGVSAEVLAAVSFAATRNARRDGADLPGIVAAAHEVLLEVSAPNQYGTLLAAEIDLSTLEMDLVVAGHPAPLYLPPDGSGPPEYLPVFAQPPTGALEEDRVYEAQRYRLEPGSTLVLFSDGLTERRDNADMMLGKEGLLELAESLRGSTLLSFVRGLLEEILGHGETPLRDDATTLVLRFAGSENE